MKEEIFKFRDSFGMKINVYKWMPEEMNVKAIIQITHGMAEWAGRYKYFAEKLCKEGYGVYAHDHRGHGKTAKNEESLGYIADKNGFNIMIEDMYELNQLIKKKKRNIPIILFGHSMGSFLVQRYIQIYGNSIDGVILSGSCGAMGPDVDFGIALSGVTKVLRGSKYKSKTINTLFFRGFNDKIKLKRTDYDWLSVNEKNVDEYIEDNYCGFQCTASFFYDFLRGIKERQKTVNVEKIPKDKPIFIISGSMDPVGKYSKGVLKLYETYEKAGMKMVEKKIYEGLRHEILNEENRDEVIKDIINWINVQVVTLSIMPHEEVKVEGKD